MSDFVPKREAELVPFTNNFASQLTAHAVAVGLTSSDATAFAALNTAWVNAYETAFEPTTRTKSANQLKYAAKRACVEKLRELSGLIQKYSGTTDALRVDFGLPIYKARSPIGIPTEIPAVEVVARVGTKVIARVHGPSGKTAKPEGVYAVQVYSFVGATAPETIDGWQFEGSSTQVREIEVEFDPSLPAGTKVWLTAAYANPRSQTGAGCPPISTTLVGGDMKVKSFNTESDENVQLKAA